MEFFCIKKQTALSSELSFPDDLVQALVDIPKYFSGVLYDSPLGAKDCINAGSCFARNHIELSYQKFIHPIYIQINYDSFLSHLSFLDYLFNADQNQYAEFDSWMEKEGCSEV